VTLNVLVISPGRQTDSWLIRRLDPRRFALRYVRPGPGLVQAVRAAPPDVAVLDGIHARPELAAIEVALLKAHNPAVQIIATSDQSSELDARVIEQGVFCYLAGCSRDELLRVLHAAAQSRGFVGREPGVPLPPVERAP
jgi:DNA-binding NarL/FixJ family response regulator